MRTLNLVLLLLAAASSGFGTTITTKTLPNGTTGTPYSSTIVSAGGCAPVTWTISGALPTGLTSAPISGTRSLALTGTPTVAGTYAFSVTAFGCKHNGQKVAYNVIIQTGAIHTVDLTWSESGQVVGYNVYRGTVSGGPYTKINLGGLVAAMLYTDATVANATTYYYVATAVDNTGAESSRSNEAMSVIP